MAIMVLKKAVKDYWCQLAAIVIDGLVENAGCGLWIPDYGLRTVHVKLRHCKI